MEKSLYPELYRLEETHWWFAGRRKILFDFLKRNLKKDAERILDIGCGTGLNALLLRSFGKEVAGLEASAEAIRFSKARNPGLRILYGTFPDVEIREVFDVITLFDVLEHFEDDVTALKKIRSILTPDGYLILTVPAFPFLWSEHDELAHHKRRYRARELSNTLKETGFETLRLSYFNTVFFPVIFLFRRLKHMFGIHTGCTDFFDVPAPLNALFGFIFGLERFLLRFSDLPLGVSIIALAQKSARNAHPQYAQRV